MPWSVFPHYLRTREAEAESEAKEWAAPFDSFMQVSAPQQCGRVALPAPLSKLSPDSGTGACIRTSAMYVIHFTRLPSQALDASLPPATTGAQQLLAAQTSASVGNGATAQSKAISRSSSDHQLALGAQQQQKQGSKAGSGGGAAAQPRSIRDAGRQVRWQALCCRYRACLWLVVVCRAREHNATGCDRYICVVCCIVWC